MKTIAAVLGLLLATAVGAFVALRSSGGETTRVEQDGDQLRAELGALREEVAALARRVDAAERVQPAVANADRGSVHATDFHAVAPPEHDARWYLEQYVGSFADDAQGSEYFRLAVDAHVVELALPIASLVRDGGRLVALRIALVNMLGKRRFDEVPDVLDALLAAVRPPSPDALAMRALEALARVGSPRIVAGLEQALPLLRDAALRARCIDLLVELSGDRANEALLRLFHTAPDDAMRRLAIRKLNDADPRAALELLRAASSGEQPVRLDAAREIQEHDDPGFDALVAEWKSREGDPQVLAVLGGADGAREAAGWSARKATGPPDADPKRDDPNAWAPKEPDMGMQWLQLRYAAPMRSNGVRIHEVNSPGAVAEVRALRPDGSWLTLWTGTAAGNGSPLWIGFPLTSFDVAVIRLVLDTNRTPGWNEIDAVELVGPSGGQWAARATASSTFANTHAVNDELQARDVLLMQRGLRR